MLLESVFARSGHESMLVAPAFRHLSSRKHGARIFVFDVAASKKHGELSVECADLVIKNEEFAIPPFDNTYIEIDNRASLEATKPLNHIAEDASQRLGYWFIENTIHCLSGDEKRPFFIPFVYRRASDEISAIYSTDREGYDRIKLDFFLGQIAPDLESQRNFLAKRLASSWDFAMTKEIPERAFREFVDECTGGLKRALAALLLLNQKQGISLQSSGPVRKIVSGKPRVYMAHNVVTIDIGRRSLRRAFNVGVRAGPVGHEVRGEFVHRFLASGCTHEWAQIDDPERDENDMIRLGYTIPRWRCQHCSGLRSWRKAHTRGDSSKGWVNKNYDVTHSVA